ncbi:lariat debranching enzyme, C-terminal domain-containing protein [Desarmillaria tabescens]|uniref:Lariat debranching enzyme, C-terminal domain-containing protein n=1 Tax=Armillaria tabescens TaxID=1929756 RepID=A0AA39NKK2_ARMTA|nr:lariat debranching enzyme, C-terminal domain-containing protein [Desarmillaria tabescens]KAK0467239.1 lariat debranching enzyme, C-terminal domain-containing protein [Desarmillaria tabescens]
MKVAVEGCCHGELDDIYAHISKLETQYAYKVNLLLICGDFQAVRNHRDLQCMASHLSHSQPYNLGYYTGEKTAPILTIIIGGNHEASNYMWELYHGGWVAPNIYFLGHAGCVQVNGIRIAGISGIFKGYNFSSGSYEKIPYDSSTIRSIYHIREFNIRRLSLLSNPDVVLSHDWPQSIDQHGDVRNLIRRKAHFRSEIEQGTFGAPPLMGLLRTLKPCWWFAAHMHVRFEATVAEPPRTNPDEISLDDEEVEVVAPPPIPASRSETKYLALDKCMPKKQFLEVVDIPSPKDVSDEPPVLCFDPEWLAITRAFNPWFSTTRYQRPFPDEAEAREMVHKELEWVKENVGSEKTVESCQQFCVTAPGPGSEGDQKFEQPAMFPNRQTRSLCQLLGIEDKINKGV